MRRADIKRFLAMAMGCLIISQTGCARQTSEIVIDEVQQEEQTEPKYLKRYRTSTATVADGNEAVLFQQDCEGGFLALINRKVRESIPDELKNDPDFVNDGRFDIYETALFHVTGSGKRNKVRRYRTLPAPENQEGLDSFFSETRVKALREAEDGRILAVEGSYESWKEEGRFRSRNRYFVRVLRENGTEISSSEIEGSSDTELDCRNLVYTGKELLAVPQKREILFFGTDGKKQFSVTTPFSIKELCRVGAGRIAVILQSDQDLWVSIVDSASRNVSVPQKIPNDAHGFCGRENGNLLYYLRNSELFQYHLDTGMSEKLISLLTLGINPVYVGSFFAKEDGSLHFLLHVWENDKEVVREQYLIAVPQEEQTEKLLLTIGFSAMSEEMTETVLQFNSSSTEVHLEGVDYRNLGENEIYTNLTDLVVLQREQYEKLAESGHLAELDELLEQDRQEWKEEFFPSVLHALADESGKLNRIAPYFRLESMVCDEDCFGGRMNINLNELWTRYEMMEPGSMLYEPYYTSERLMEDLCAVNRAALRNESSSLFEKLLAFSQMQPQLYSYQNYTIQRESMEARIQSGHLLLLQAHIGSLDDLKWYDSFFENGACFIGWPTETGSHSRIVFDECVAVSAACSAEQRTAAGVFIRTMLMQEDNGRQYGFPVLRKQLEKLLDEDAENVSYRVDDKGEFELNAKGQKIEIARSSWYSPEWRKHYVYAVTPTQREKLISLIESGVS